MNRFFAILITIFIILNFPAPAYAADTITDKAEEAYRLGNLFDHYMTESYVMLGDVELDKKISDVTDKIVAASGQADNKYRVRVINDTLPLSAAFPGYVYVSTGMLDILDNEEELASVIAHSVAHVVEKDQYQTYNDVLWNKNVSKFIGHITPLLFFSGIGGIAIAGQGISAAYAATFEGLILVESGFYSVSSLTGALTERELHEKKIVMNRLVPHINLTDTKTGLSVMVFLGDLYGGYGEERELHADNLAIDYVVRAGYRPESYISVLNKISGLSLNHVARGHLYHFMMARPGLKKRIVNAESIITNNK